MAKKSAPKKAPPKPRRVKETPRYWREGTEKPQWLEDVMNARAQLVKQGLTEKHNAEVSKLVNEIEALTLENRMLRQLPESVTDAVGAIFKVLGNLTKKDTIQAVGLFMHELRKRSETSLKSARVAIEIMNEEADKLERDMDSITSIMRGDFAVIVPKKNFEPGANLKKMDTDKAKTINGEAVISQRDADRPN